MSSYASNAIFPIYLFIASIANVVFLVYSVRDLIRNESERGSSWALFSLALAELLWVVPCFLQCFAKWVSDGGDHWWVPAESDVGCDIMGFYSIFASISGMYLVAMMAYMSYSYLCFKERLSVRSVLIWIGASYGMALLQCILALSGVGSFKYSGEGFCYIDWSDTGQAVCMALASIPIFFTTLYWFGCCVLHVEAPQDPEAAGSEAPATTPKWWWWSLFFLAYFSAWVLWIPAVFIGPTSDKPYPDMFPSGYMVMGGALGHLQALINPYIYGVEWKAWYQADPVATNVDKASKISPVTETAVVDKLDWSSQKNSVGSDEASAARHGPNGFCCDV